MWYHLLCKYANLFTKSDKVLGRTAMAKHSINTGSHKPIKEVHRRLLEHMNAEVENHVKVMLENKVIEPSKSPWASRLVLVKKQDGSSRFCIDYRRLIAITEKYAYPIPRIDPGSTRKLKWTPKIKRRQPLSPEVVYINSMLCPSG